MSLSHPLDWEFFWIGVPDMASLKTGTTKGAGCMVDEETDWRESPWSAVTQQVGRTTKARDQVSWFHSVLWFYCVTKNREDVNTERCYKPFLSP